MMFWTWNVFVLFALYVSGSGQEMCVPGAHQRLMSECVPQIIRGLRVKPSREQVMTDTDFMEVFTFLCSPSGRTAITCMADVVRSCPAVLSRTNGSIPFLPPGTVLATLLSGDGYDRMCQLVEMSKTGQQCQRSSLLQTLPCISALLRGMRLAAHDPLGAICGEERQHLECISRELEHCPGLRENVLNDAGPIGILLKESDRLDNICHSYSCMHSKPSLMRCLRGPTITNTTTGFATSTGTSASLELLPWMTRNRTQLSHIPSFLQFMCGKGRSQIQCQWDLFHECPSLEHLHIPNIGMPDFGAWRERIQHPYEFIQQCDEGSFNEFLKNEDCIVRQFNSTSLQVCLDKPLADIAQNLVHCKIMESLADCLEEPVERYCGGDEVFETLVLGMKAIFGSDDDCEDSNSATDRTFQMDTLLLVLIVTLMLHINLDLF